MRLFGWEPFLHLWAYPFPRRMWGYQFMPWDQFGKEHPDFDLAEIVLWRFRLGCRRFPKQS